MGHLCWHTFFISMTLLRLHKTHILCFMNLVDFMLMKSYDTSAVPWDKNVYKVCPPSIAPSSAAHVLDNDRVPSC